MVNLYQRTMGFFSLPEQDEVVFMNKPVRTPEVDPHAGWCGDGEL